MFVAVVDEKDGDDNDISCRIMLFFNKKFVSLQLVKNKTVYGKDYIDRRQAHG